MGFFPQFFSTEECNDLLRLALRFQQPAEEEAPVIAVPLPKHLACSTLAVAEERMTSALNVQSAGSPDAALLWEEKGVGEYIRLNDYGPKGNIRAKMIVWL